MKVAMDSGHHQAERTRIEFLPDPLIDSTMSRHLLSAEIFASSQDLDKVIVRLGGFHLLMSYLGSIGHIMSGSGLAELWETVYANNSVIHAVWSCIFSLNPCSHSFIR